MHTLSRPSFTSATWPRVRLAPGHYHLTADLCTENGTPFVVAGSGKPLRQFIYSRDLGKMFIWLIREYDDVEPVILSVGEEEEVTIKQVADAIVKAVGFEGDYSFDTSKADGQYRKPASNKKLLDLMGGFEFTPFEKGKLRSFLVFCSYLSSIQLWMKVSPGSCRTMKQRVLALRKFNGVSRHRGWTSLRGFPKLSPFS